ncbi:MAG: conjugal transfer protein TrbI, partial [Shinella sp.]
MSDPNYHSIDTDTYIGGEVRRGGIGLIRPFAVVAGIAGVGAVLYFLLAGGEAEPPIDTTPREEFRPVQTPRNEGFRTPSPPPLPTVEIPEAPPPPPPPPAPRVPAAAPVAPPAEIDCSRGKNPDDPKCIELERKAKLLERVRSSAMVFDQSDQTRSASATSSDASGAGMFGVNSTPGASTAVNGEAGSAVDGDRAFLKAMGGQGVEVSVATENRRTDAWIPQGTMIRGTLETAINSDLAGMVKGIVREDVYSFDGRRILIP